VPCEVRDPATELLQVLSLLNRWGTMYRPKLRAVSQCRAIMCKVFLHIGMNSPSQDWSVNPATAKMIATTKLTRLQSRYSEGYLLLVGIDAEVTTLCEVSFPTSSVEISGTLDSLPRKLSQRGHGHQWHTDCQAWLSRHA